MSESMESGRAVGRPWSIRLALVAVILPVAVGCGYYSFSGATIPEHLGTIAIPLVEDNSISTITALDEQMTQLLIERFVQQTRLSLEPTEDDANALLVVTIDRYVNAPASVSGDERATRNRVTITVSVEYDDHIENRSLLQRSFSSFEEYDPLDPSKEEEAAVAALVKIADDIFTAATSNW